jgi:hypothetical protein
VDLGVDGVGEQAQRLAAGRPAVQEPREHAHQIVAAAAEQERLGTMGHDGLLVLEGRADAPQHIGSGAHAQCEQGIALVVEQVVGDVVDQRMGHPRVALAHHHRQVRSLVAKPAEPVQAPGSLGGVGQTHEPLAEGVAHRPPVVVDHQAGARAPAVEERRVLEDRIEVLDQRREDAFVVVDREALA